MDIVTPFAMPVGVFDVSEHLPLLRNMFQEAKEEIKLCVPGFSTSLSEYSMGKDENYLPENDETASLRQAIMDAAVQLALTMGYDAAIYKPVIKNFWFNEMVSGGTHTIHSHYGVHFSGCIYVDMPDNSGDIVFSSYRERYDYQPMKVAQYTMFNSGTWGYNPKEGHLFLWESWIRHSVPATTFEGVRRTVAFDVFMELK